MNKQPIIDETQDPGVSRVPVQQQVSTSKVPISMPKFHWVRDKVDKRDFAYKPTAVKEVKAVDLRQYCSPIEDQGMLGSCTGQAIAGAIELLNKRNRKPADVSRLFIYYYERLLLGTVNYDSGAYIRDGIKATYKFGAPLESLWPYLINRFKQNPSAIANKDALNRKVTLYERATNFNSCINALTNGYPVIVGYDVYSSFMSNSVAKTGLMPYPDTRRETLLGGHAVLLVGFNHATQCFIARNSWGTSWGDKGYFYMPYKIIQNATMSDDFWVIKTVNSP